MCWCGETGERGDPSNHWALPLWVRIPSPAPSPVLLTRRFRSRMLHILEGSPRSQFRYVRKPESKSSPAFAFPRRLLDRKLRRAYYRPMGYSGRFAFQSQLRELNERNYARLEAKLDRLIGEVRAEMRLDQLRGQMRAGFDMLDATLDGFQSRMTMSFFVYFMSQGLLTAATILWMIGILQ